jgi:hypothetical protein
MFKYEVSIPAGAQTITLPANDKIKVFAITLANKENDDVKELQPLYDDFSNNQPYKLRSTEYVTPDMSQLNIQPMPLWDKESLQRIKSNPRYRRYFQSQGLDTIQASIPSTEDYADVKSGNKVSLTYYATGVTKAGESIQGKKLDIQYVLDSQSGKLTDSIWFDNGEGRYVIDLQKTVSVNKLNFYFDRFRQRGSGRFSIWGSSNSSDITGSPKEKGWQYVGSSGSSFGPAPAVSLVFKDGLSVRYLMFVTDSNWHGNDYFKQIDIFKN